MTVPSDPGRGVLTAHRRWAVAVSVACAVSVLSAPPSMADPDPATSTVLRVSVGGDRTGANQADVSPLDGVTLGAYSDTSSVPVATCTSVAGICSLVIPDTDVDGANYDQRLWIRQTSVPTGWYANPQLRTGSSSATPATVRDYEFRTPRLTEREYLSDELMPATGMSAGSETAALGHWQQSRDNPALPARCGIGRVVILTDWSGSVGRNPGYPTLVATLDKVADAFAGTQASLSFSAFGYQQIPASSDYYPMSSPSEVAAFKSLYAGWDGDDLGSQGTNWDAGLRAAAAADPDLVIMLTDGSPTVWGSGAQGQSHGSYNQLADVEAAIFAANALKSSGTRIVALGVGDGVAPASHGNLNLRAVSGPTKFTGSNYLAADYFQTTDYDEAAEAFREMAMASCEGSLTVVKQIVPPNGTIADAVVAGPGWQFTVSGDAVTDGTGSTKTDQTGTVGFDLEVDGAFTTTVKISERQLAGYTLLPADGQSDGPRAVCTAVGSITTRPVTNDPDDPHGVILTDLPVHESTTCTFYNQAPEEPTSVQVDKRWVINGEPVANGDQPAGLEASLALVALPRASGQYPVANAQFGEKYLRYPDGVGSTFMAADDVTIGETVTDGPYCTADPRRTTIHALARESDPGYDGVSQVLRANHKANLSADPEWNHFVITNYADCTPAPRWTLAKTSDPVTGSTVERGDRVTYTVTATNLEPQSVVSLQNLTVVDDLSGVLAQADLDPASMVASTGSATFSGTGLTWTIDTLDDTATLTYQVVLHADADDGATIANSVYGQPTGGDPENPFTQGIPPEQCQEDEPCGTIHYTPRTVVPTVVYDLALRMWVGQVYRDQHLVHQLFPHLSDVGPDYDEPFVGFDNAGYGTLPGDLTVHNIHLFNQGTGTARVEQLVGYLPAEGLALADPADVAAITPVDGPITNDYWSLGSDGNLYYDPPDPIVLLPGETARVPLTLVVGTVAAPDLSVPYTPVVMYAEISQFSGLVDEDAGVEIDPDDLISGFGAAWLPVEDADSHPDAVNNEPADNHYKNHVIDEHAFANISGVRTSLAAVDEDDHDGSHLRVVRLEVLLDPADPVGGSPSGGSGGLVYDVLAWTGGDPWLVGGIALVVMVAGGATLAWSRRMRSAGR